MSEPQDKQAVNRQQDEERYSRGLARIKKVVSLTFTSLLLCAAGLVLLFLFFRSQALPVTKVIQTSQIYDAQGELIDSLYTGQDRQVVSLKDVSPYLVKATLSIEDRNFYNHFGFDLRAIARASIVNIQHMSKVQGAGTITQQLARNLYLTHDKTWMRKIKETLFAVQMETQLSKDQILEQYLNQIYYGHSTYGIQTASRLYFNKDAKDLTLAESALIAGIPKGPKYYSPYLNKQNALDRQKIVLDTMVRDGFITQEEADKASQEHLAFQPLKERKPSEAPYFRDYVRKIATEKLGITEDQFDEGGIKVYTTLELRAQKIAEEAVAKQLLGTGDLQAALISIDPRNGYIKAMVGGRDYKENQFNRTLATSRQTGSSFKPIVYLTALQKPGFTALTKYKSEPTTFTYDDGKKTYTPSNFGNLYHGEIGLREAMAKSDNIFAVHTIIDVGADKVIETARKLGITSPMNPVPSLALGTFPVSPLEMASAFAAIANLGERIEPIAITRIEDAYGDTLFEAAPVKEKVVEPSYAYVLTHLMQSVFESGGTANRVSSIINRPVAGKTGTTDTDSWMIGFTPELATAVWVGYDKNRAVSSVESIKAAPIFAEFTERSLETVPPKQFAVPEGVIVASIDPASDKLANDDCANSRVEAFITGTQPTAYCTDSSKKDKTKPGRSLWEDLKRWFVK